MLSRTISQEDRVRAFAELIGHLDGLIAAKAKESADDLLSRRLAKSDDREEMRGLTFLLLVVGHEQQEVLDIERGARNHIAFGFGAHQRLGQNLTWASSGRACIPQGRSITRYGSS